MNDDVRAAGQVTDSDLYNLAVYADTFRHHEHMEFNTAMIARVVAELKQRRDATPPDAAGPDLGRLLPDCLWAVETLKNLATRAAVKGFDLGGDAGEGIVKLAHLEHELRFLARRGRDAERELAELRERAEKAEAERMNWRAWTARIIGFDHVATAKTDDHMREDIKEELQRLIDRVGEVEADRDRLRKALESVCEMADDELRRVGAVPGSNVAQIEADARAALVPAPEVTTP